MAETGRKEISINAMAEAGLKYIKDLGLNVLFKSYFHFHVVSIFT